MQITTLAVAAIRGVPGLMQKIADLEGVTLRTVQKWIQFGDSSITKANIIKLIKDETGLTDDQILEEVAEVAAK
jgi:hypothetical protein